MLKKFIVIFFILSIAYSPIFNAESKLDDIYDEQFKNSGSGELIDKLPKGTAKTLDSMGIKGKSFKEFSKITPNKIFEEIINEGKSKFSTPLKAIIPVMSIILLNALMESIGISLGGTELSSVISAVSSLCICICIINPIISCILSTSAVIKGASNFILYFVPVIAGIMITLGQTVSASSYHILMITAGQFISQLSTNLLVPLMSTLLGISVISSVSSRLKLDNLCDLMYRIIKWCLWASTSIFTAILTIQNLVSSSADNIGNKTAKLALSSFVPIVGNALGDAFSTVQGCVKLLKSGAGAFGIIAGGVIFIPAIVECCIWIMLLTVCSAASEIFSLNNISGLLKSSSKVMQAMLAVILSCITILIISTVIILLIGGGS